MGKKVIKVINSIIWIVLITIIIFVAVDRFSARYLPDTNIIDKYNLNKFVTPKPVVYLSGKPYLNLGKEALNAIGYRGEIPPHKKHPDEYRIFILGGSTVFLGNPSIPILVERYLKYTLSDGHTTFLHPSVYNFGVLSQNSGMELARIVFEVSDFKPDMIIMYSGANDIHSPVFADPRPGYPCNFMIRENNPLQMTPETYPALTMLLWKSNLFRYLISQNTTILDYYKEELFSFSRLRKECDYMSEQWINSIAQTYCRNIKKASIISNSCGAHFLGFFQPTVFYKDYLDAKEKIFLEQFTEKEIEYHLKIRSIIRAEFKRMSQENIHVRDISDIYDSTPETVFTDFCHTTQNQKIKVAAEISREILPLLYKQVKN